MAVDIQITGLTAGQLSEMADAFGALQPVPVDRDGQPLHPKSRWAKMCILQFVKANVYEYRARAKEVEKAAVRGAVDSEFGSVA